MTNSQKAIILGIITAIFAVFILIWGFGYGG